MASTQLSGIGVTDLRGSIGGTTWQLNANGLFSRNKPNGTQPNTNSQLEAQAIFKTVQDYWAVLNDTQRLEWIAAAASPAGQYSNRLGQIKNYTGQQYFMKTNLAAYSTSFPITSPQLRPRIESRPAISLLVELAAGELRTVQVALDAWQEGLSLQVKFFLTFGLSQGIMRPKGTHFRLISIITAETGAFTYDLKENYLATFGAPPLGSKVFCKTFFMDTVSGYEFNNGQIVTTVVA